jgi:WD40 repeat protein
MDFTFNNEETLTVLGGASACNETTDPSDSEERHKMFQNQNNSTEKTEQHQLNYSQLDLHGKEINSIFFSPIHPSVFCLLSKNEARIYEIDNNGSFFLRQSYQDSQVDENFRNGAFSCMNDGTPILAIGGEKQVIKVINCFEKKLKMTLIGHGKPINQILFHPLELSILFSSCFDLSIRMWSLVNNGICVAIFGGFGGHLFQEADITIDVSENKLLSLGRGESSATLKIWNIEELLKKAKSEIDEQIHIQFKTIPVPLSDFTNSQIHSSPATCAKWVGNFVLSKSAKDMMLWTLPFPGRPKRNLESISVLNEINFEEDAITLPEIFLNFSQNLVYTLQPDRVVVWKLDQRCQKCFQFKLPPDEKIQTIALSSDEETMIVLTEVGIYYFKQKIS